MAKPKLTIGQLKRLKRVLIDGLGKPELIIKLLQEIDHPEMLDALIDSLLSKITTEIWLCEHAIRIGKGNLSKLEDRLISEVMARIKVKTSPLISMVNIAKTKNINIEKIQDTVITCEWIHLNDAILMLEDITKIKGANIEKTLKYYEYIKKTVKIKSLHKLIDISIDKIECSYKYRAKNKYPTQFANDEQIQVLLDLIRVKTVQDI
jgi:hypothetical protein